MSSHRLRVGEKALCPQNPDVIISRVHNCSVRISFCCERPPYTLSLIN